jgi:hypothetical protein
MRTSKEIRDKWNQIQRHSLADTLQVCFVAVIWIGLFGLLFLTQGCAPKPRVGTGNPLTAEIAAGEKANTYSVHLRWDVNQEPSFWLVHRKREGQIGDSEQIASVQGNCRNADDTSAQSGTTYTYYLGAVNADHYLLTTKLTVTIPKDFEVTGAMKPPLEGLVGFNRLIFLPGSRLVTDGADLKVEVNEILSEEGVIETFPTDNKSAFGKPGRNGGEISVKAKIGKGILHIFGRGQTGGDGVMGKPGFTGRRGFPGYPATATHGDLQRPCECGAIAEALKKEMGNPVLAALSGAGMQFFLLRANHHCLKEATPGIDGFEGGPGWDGEKGSRGGDSSRIYLEVENTSELLVKAYPIPGQGGTGGSGGQGGEGGPGGSPGNHERDPFGNCQETPWGAVGQKGAQGQRGLSGSAGATLPMCSKLGTTRFGDCDQFKSEGGKQ